MNHLEEREVMKFVINGRSFDTTASNTLAICRGVFIPMHEPGYYKNDENYIGAEQVRYEETLFRTPKGALFIVDHRTLKFPKGKPVVEDHPYEVTPEEAVKWIADNGAAILDASGLPLPDEA